jgi:phosphoglycolate phosphatase-like HAD superfamily hydrolase
LRYFFWDIDGTLLTTGRAGIIAWERAVKDVFGHDADFTELRTAGLIDPEIALMVSQQACPNPSDEQIARVLQLYESHLPSCLPLRRGRVLPNVREILEHLAEMDDVCSRLLTGNTRAGAAAKLGHYGLSAYFEGGAFSDGCRVRDEVALCADRVIPNAQRHGCEIYVIGDTPHDVRCAAAIGARAIAVATGEYGVEELRSRGAWLALSELPEPKAFLELLH